jgi:hypothetical protein
LGCRGCTTTHHLRPFHLPRPGRWFGRRASGYSALPSSARVRCRLGGRTPSWANNVGSSSGDRSATSRCTGERATCSPCAQGRTGGTSGDNAARRKTGPYSGAGAKLRTSGDDAAGNAGTEDAKTQQRKRRQHSANNKPSWVSP